MAYETQLRFHSIDRVALFCNLCYHLIYILLWVSFVQKCQSLLQVIAAAQAGKHNDKRESYGDTLIIDPWGSVISRLPGEIIF